MIRSVRMVPIGASAARGGDEPVDLRITAGRVVEVGPGRRVITSRWHTGSRRSARQLRNFRDQLRPSYLA